MIPNAPQPHRRVQDAVSQAPRRFASTSTNAPSPHTIPGTDATVSRIRRAPGAPPRVTIAVNPATPAITNTTASSEVSTVVAKARVWLPATMSAKCDRVGRASTPTAVRNDPTKTVTSSIATRPTVTQPTTSRKTPAPSKGRTNGRRVAPAASGREENRFARGMSTNPIGSSHAA